jgi:hypothetical protein
VFTLWFHTYAQDDEATALVMRTLGAVFPHVEVFIDREMANVVAVAAAHPLDPDFPAMERRFASPPVRFDLKRIELPTLAALLTHHRHSPRVAEFLAGPGPARRWRPPSPPAWTRRDTR